MLNSDYCQRSRPFISTLGVSPDALPRHRRPQLTHEPGLSAAAVIIYIHCFLPCYGRLLVCCEGFWCLFSLYKDAVKLLTQCCYFDYLAVTHCCPEKMTY